MFRMIFQTIMILILKPYAYFVQHLRIKKNGIKLPKGPVLFLSNHHNNRDGLWLRLLNPWRRIFFLVHEEVYKNRFAAFCAGNLIDLVKRGKKGDTGPIRELLKRSKKYSIGIYPEGGIKYFNDTMPIDISIAKLAKLFNMPVVLCNIHGASFNYPRWAKHSARIKPVYEYRRLITKEELKKLSTSQLHDIISENLYVNDYDWQQNAKVKIKRKEPYAHLDRGLFACPNCKQLKTLAPKPHGLCCDYCGLVATFDEYQFFKFNKSGISIKDLVEWDKYQQNLLKQIAESGRISAKSDNVNMKYTMEVNAFEKNGEVPCSIALDNNNLTITTQVQEQQTMELQKIVFPYVEHRNILQFVYEDRKYRFEGENFSAYYWVCMIQVLQHLSNEKQKGQESAA